MEIQQRESDHKGSFFIEVDGRQVAVMTYLLKPDNILVIDHTKVDDSLKGKNIGSQLVTKAVDFARQKKFRIRPLCSFARAVLEKKRDEYADVLEVAT